MDRREMLQILATVPLAHAFGIPAGALERAAAQAAQAAQDPASFVAQCFTPHELRAPEPMQAGVAFFNRFRDLVASGFWSSKIGVEDLRYMGNTVVPQWNGCPDEALQHLGVTYAD